MPARPCAPTGWLPPEPPKPGQTGWAAARSPINLSEHDVERTEDRGDVGQQMAPTDKIPRLQMGKARRADLAFIGLVAAVGDQEDAELPLRRLDRGIDFAFRHVEALGVELEVMDQGLHRTLHLGPPRWRDLVILDDDRPLPVGCTQLGDALPHDAHRLADLF